MREPTDQEVLHLISRISMDEFVADLEWDYSFWPGRLNEREKELWRRLSSIYEMSHSFDKSASCYGHHETWAGRYPELAKKYLERPE
jgi:hypothetical protein